MKTLKYWVSRPEFSKSNLSVPVIHACTPISPIIENNSEFILKADIIIKALGFDPENLPNLFQEKDLKVSTWGTIKVDFDTMETNLPGVFAAGDIIRGASLVVWAIRDGREAANSIKNYLEKIESKKAKVAW